MATFNGNFQYTDHDGKQQQGPCQVEFDKETFTLSSESPSASLSFDLGDIDGIVSDRHQLRLPLYTGAVLVLNQVGSSYDNLVAELTKARRAREVQCLLLADMPELASFPGHFECVAGGMQCAACGAAGVSGKFCRQCGAPLQSTAPTSPAGNCPKCGARDQSGHFCRQCGGTLPTDSASKPTSGDAELRLFKTNLALLPEHAPGFQVRLGDAKQVRHEPNSYEIFLDLGNESLKFSGLGKRTNEFADKLRQAVNETRSTSAQALHLAFPFLNPDQLQHLATLLPEGSAAAVSELTQVDPRIADALVKNAVDKDLQPYYQALYGMAAGEATFAGFKLIRPEDQQGPSEENDHPFDSDHESRDADEKGPDALYWFFFPLHSAGKKANVVAWEASSRGGRATYFFRIEDQSGLDQQVHRLNRGLGILNFRRRPIYLSEAELTMNPVFRRYAIAARRIPELRQLRTAFLGRAIHSSVEAWHEQVKGILAKSI